MHQSDYSVSVIDGAPNSVIDNVPLSTGALVDAVNITTGRVYLAGCTYTQSKVMRRLRARWRTDKVIATLPINAANSSAIDVNPVSRLVYTSAPADGLVHVISE